MLRRLRNIRPQIITHKDRIPRVHIKHEIRPIIHIHEPQRLIAPVRDIPHLALRPIRVAHTWLSFRRSDLGWVVADGELLEDARLTVTEGVAALCVVDGLELPVLLDGRPDVEGAVCHVHDLQGGCEFWLGIVVDTAFANVVPDVGVEGDRGKVGGAVGRHCGGLDVKDALFV